MGNTRSRRLGAFVVAATLIAGCSGSDGDSAPTTSQPPTTVGSDPNPPTAATTSDRLGLRLSEGTATDTTDDAVTTVDGTPLTAEQYAAVVDRLPAWTVETGGEPFNWPAQTIQRPQAGATVDVPFPAPEATPPPETASGPLHVLRHQPDGEIALAPFVTVTFDQPMVALGTVAQTDAAAVPVTIVPTTAGAPTLEGTWSWIGTRTIRFDATSGPAGRLPMATEYEVTVPAGTTSANGGVLAADESFTFRTPARHGRIGDADQRPAPVGTGVRGHVRSGHRSGRRARHRPPHRWR